MLHIHKHIIRDISRQKTHQFKWKKKQTKPYWSQNILHLFVNRNLINNVFSRNTSLYNYISSRFLLCFQLNSLICLMKNTILHFRIYFDACFVTIAGIPFHDILLFQNNILQFSFYRRYLSSLSDFFSSRNFFSLRHSEYTII